MNESVYIGNRGGIPVVSVTPVVSATDVRLPLPNHVFRWLGSKGVMVIEMSAIPVGTTGTLPVLVETNGETKPLLLNTGVQAPAADLEALTLIEVVWDKTKGTVQLVSL